MIIILGIYRSKQSTYKTTRKEKRKQSISLCETESKMFSFVKESKVFPRVKQKEKFDPVSCLVSIILKHPPYIYSLEPQLEKTYLQTYAPTADSLDQSAQSRSLIRIVTVRILDSQIWKISLCGQRRIWWQADSSLHWADMTDGTFSHVVVHLFCT